MVKASQRPARLSCAGVLLVALLLGPAPAAAVEKLDYRWQLKGFGGFLVGLFFPDSGEASLITEPGPGSGLRTHLEIVSPKRQGEYYRYGAEIGERGDAVRVWFSSSFRGETKRSEEVLEKSGVLDFAAAIHVLRREMPEEARKLCLWSEGKLYPLVLSPAGVDEIDVSGQSWQARHYLAQGLRIDGERFWKGRFHLWLAFDERRTPVRIVGERGLLTVRLDLEQISRSRSHVDPPR